MSNHQALVVPFLVGCRCTFFGAISSTDILPLLKLLYDASDNLV